MAEEHKMPDPDQEPLTLNDFLDWIRQFASEEGTRLFQEGRRVGAEVASDTAARLVETVRAAGSALRPLLEAIVADIEKLRSQLERLYDTAFVETAESPVVIPPVELTEATDAGGMGQSRPVIARVELTTVTEGEGVAQGQPSREVDEQPPAGG
jgi:hypothetical protein